MANRYLHGAYGELGQTLAPNSAKVNTLPVYFGTAPVHLVRGWADKKLVNSPVMLQDFTDAQRKLGYCEDWEKYTLCEAMDAHFRNGVQAVGPICMINVLDPGVFLLPDQSSTITMTRGRGKLINPHIILDSIEITGSVEDVDYTIDYDYGSSTLLLKDLSGAMGATVTINYDEVDPSMVDNTNLIGGLSAAGEYSGMAALRLVQQYYNQVPALLCAPGWSEDDAVHDALIAAAQQINGHWEAFVNADIPTDTVTNIQAAIDWGLLHGRDSERAKYCWPMGARGSHTYHGSTIATVRMQQTDYMHNSIPYESASNKPIDIDYVCLADASRLDFDQIQANELNAAGITTMINWRGRWLLWGPHTGAFKYNADNDARSIFDVSIRMMFYIINQFQLTYGPEIDKPYTRGMKDKIIVECREWLDRLIHEGALLSGNVNFLESSNVLSDMLNGDFVFDFAVTVTPPAKSLTARVSYTSEGFSAYFEEVSTS